MIWKKSQISLARPSSAAWSGHNRDKESGIFWQIVRHVDAS